MIIPVIKYSVYFILNILRKLYKKYGKIRDSMLCINVLVRWIINHLLN